MPAWHTGSVCLNCVTGRLRGAAAVIARLLARQAPAVKANVPSGPAANGRAAITASTFSGP